MVPNVRRSCFKISWFHKSSASWLHYRCTCTFHTGADTYRYDVCSNSSFFPLELKRLKQEILQCTTLSKCVFNCEYVDQKARLPCWPSRGQQVLHQGWIWRIYSTQVTKHSNKGFYPGFETPDRRHHKSKRGASVALQRELMSSNH